MNRVLMRKWLRKAAVVGGKAAGAYHSSQRALAVDAEEWLRLASRAAALKFKDTLSGTFPSDVMADHAGLMLSTDREWCIRWVAFDLPSSFVRGGSHWMTACGARKMESQEFEIVALYSLSSNTLFHASRMDGDCRKNNATLSLKPKYTTEDLRVGLLVEDGSNDWMPDWAPLNKLLQQARWAPLVTGPLSSFAALSTGATDVLLVPPAFVHSEAAAMGELLAMSAGAVAWQGSGSFGGWKFYAHPTMARELKLPSEAAYAGRF